MISSKPADRGFLDHDYVEDERGRLYVVIGNSHPPNYVIAYLKYVPTEEVTPWRRGDKYYARVVKRYGVRNVMPSVRPHQEFIIDSMLNAPAPIVRLSNVVKHYLPELRLGELIKHADDELEIRVLEVIDRIRECCNVPLSNLGITGSLLPRIHNIAISDIDLVVYGCRESVEVCEYVSKCFERAPKGKLVERLRSRAKAYGLSIDQVIKLEAPYRMLYLRNREVNICFSDKYTSRYCEFTYVPLGKALIKVKLASGDCKSLYYPSRAQVEKVIDVIKSEVNEYDVKSRLKYIISYESIYSYIMFRGGEVITEGVVEEVLPSRDLVLIIGAQENPGYLLPSS